MRSRWNPLPWPLLPGAEFAPMVACAVGLVMCLAKFVRSDDEHTSQPPYPQSPVITGAEFDFDSIHTYGKGSDQWPMTVGADGNLYAAWGDGWGWKQTGDKASKRSIGVTRISGESPDLQGIDLWGDGPGHGFSKPEALLAIDQTLFMFWTRGDSINDLDNSATAVSQDGGVSWTYGKGKAFPELPDGFRVRSICQFGPGYCNARDDYVYIYFGVNRGDDLYLARVLRDRILAPSNYEWMTGLDRDEGANWSQRSDDRQSVFHDPNGYVWHVGVSYNAGLKRYLLTKAHYAPDDNRALQEVKDSGVAGFGLFDAPAPWGPWTTVDYRNEFKDRLVKFSYFLPTSFMSDDGKTCWLSWSGWPEYDSLSLVRVQLNVR